MKLSISLALISASAASAYNIGGGPLFYRTTAWPVARRLPSAFDSMSPFGLSILDDRIQQRQDRFRRQVDQLNRIFDMTTAAAMGPSSPLSSPSFQVLSDDTASVVAVDVPGIPMEDIHVEIDDEQRLMTISGKREMSKGGVSSVTKFSRTFQVDERARLDELTATLENGVLTVRAPKDPIKEEEEEDPVVEDEEPTKLRRIPIDVVGSAGSSLGAPPAGVEVSKDTVKDSTEPAADSSPDKTTTNPDDESGETLDLDTAPAKVESESQTVAV